LDLFDRELPTLLPRLRRLAHALARNRADADDLAQATVERMLRARDQWQPDTRFDAWSFRIMRNLWIDTGRAATRLASRSAPAEAGLAVGEDPTDQLEQRSELVLLMQALAWLCRGGGGARRADRHYFQPDAARPPGVARADGRAMMGGYR
jgi:RNA polymerase sigma factor (sigma-70 family)